MGIKDGDEILCQRLKDIREANNMRQNDVAKIMGTTKATISRWENGVHSPKVLQVKYLAEIFHVSPKWLSGMSDDKYGDGAVETKRLPIIGIIAAGVPIFAQQNIDGYELVLKDCKADFCLKVRGDSMIGARILDGDIVYIRQQGEVENGEIAAVLVGDEATLKRFYRLNGTVVLRAENPNYKDLIYNSKTDKDISILGKAVEFRSEVR